MVVNNGASRDSLFLTQRCAYARGCASYATLSHIALGQSHVLAGVTSQCPRCEPHPNARSSVCAECRCLRIDITVHQIVCVVCARPQGVTDGNGGAARRRRREEPSPSQSRLGGRALVRDQPSLRNFFGASPPAERPPFNFKKKPGAPLARNPVRTAFSGAGFCVAS